MPSEFLNMGIPNHNHFKMSLLTIYSADLWQKSTILTMSCLCNCYSLCDFSAENCYGTAAVCKCKTSLYRRLMCLVYVWSGITSRLYVERTRFVQRIRFKLQSQFKKRQCDHVLLYTHNYLALLTLQLIFRHHVFVIQYLYVVTFVIIKLFDEFLPLFLSNVSLVSFVLLLNSLVVLTTKKNSKNSVKLNSTRDFTVAPIKPEVSRF